MGWQDAVAIGVVLGAVFYLSSLGWKGLIGGKGGSCASSCGKCSTGDGKSGGADIPEQLVTIGSSRSSPRVQASAASVDQSRSS
jgi:hypothetical protein